MLRGFWLMRWRGLVIVGETRRGTRFEGDLLHFIYPGCTWNGWSYDEFLDLDEGDHEIKVPREEQLGFFMVCK
jgi:hypothetical protein